MSVKGFDKMALHYPERMREIAKKGQAALAATGKRHRFTKEQARAAAMIAVNNRKNGKLRKNDITRPVQDSAWLEARERRIQAIQDKCNNVQR